MIENKVEIIFQITEWVLTLKKEATRFWIIQTLSSGYRRKGHGIIYGESTGGGTWRKISIASLVNYGTEFKIKF